MATGGGGNEFQPHPIKEQLSGLDYCIRSYPSWPEALFLGFQHYVVMLGTVVIVSTILVPLMGGGNVEKAEMIQTMLFFAGIKTLCQTLFGTRLPVVIGPSFAFLIPAISIALSTGTVDPDERFIQSITAVALIVASFVQAMIGYFGLFEEIARFLSPLSAVPLVTLTGLGLVVLWFPKLADCIEIGLPTLVILIILSQDPTPFPWGLPTFNIGDVCAMIAASLVAIIESTGTFIAASRFGGATPVPPSVLSRGVGWLGVGTLLDSLFGAPTGSAASVQNVGLLGLTRVGSRRVIQISAGFMFFFSIFGKFGAVIAAIPLPIIAAVYCVLFAYVASAGLGFLQFCNLNSNRSMFIVGISLFLGLSIPQYFSQSVILSGDGPIQSTVRVMFTSSATVAVLVALFLDVTMTPAHPSVRRDSGRHWWERFRSYRQDIRSREFYALPMSLNRYFPSN